MFNESFYPTPAHVIELMIGAEDLQGKTILEPSAGKGDILDYCKDKGAETLLACEVNPTLQVIVKSKAQLIAEDFFMVESDRISHVDYIIMNPPFLNADKHILHAYEIAPAGCKIIALCNLQTVENAHTQTRQRLIHTIQENGNYRDIGDVFKNAERTTSTHIALIILEKPGENYKAEFSGFFMEEGEEQETGEGIMQYSAVRDLVNRYVGAVKLFDKQIEDGIKMNALTRLFYKGNICFECTEDSKTKTRQQFKNDLQRDAWKYIFNIMKMDKYSTKGVKEDINKFIEQQTNIPFTMKNIYRMFEIVIGTAESRMNKAIEEAFDRITKQHHENRHQVKGWKTNSHFLVNRKFILDYMINPAKEYGYTSKTYNHLKNSYDGVIPDMEKALCFTEGIQYNPIEYGYNNKVIHEGILTLSQSINQNTYGEWYESHFFRYKGYKNGNMHFEFKDENVWARFNQRVSKIKGYPLYEAKTQTKWQDARTGRQQPKQEANPVQSVLFKIEL